MKKTFVLKITVLFLILFSSFKFYVSGNESLILSETGIKEKSIIDIHCHTAGLGYGNSGCFISEELKKSWKFRIYLKAMGVTIAELEKNNDSFVIEKFSQNLKNSRLVKKAVVLAMDGVISKGELDKEKTELYVPNEYVLNECKKYDNLLFGASINPKRNDALERLVWAKANGAVLIKWLPSIMDIDPSDEGFIPFYRKLIELNLPLLTHTGKERSFSGSNDELCDPVKLELPLKLGVKIIAAHIATTGTNAGIENFERIIPMLEKYSGLYTDISSLTQINKRRYLVKALKIPLVKSKMIYGTDWPLQFFPLISPFYHLDAISLKQALNVLEIKNQWDRDILLKYYLGVSAEVFSRNIPE